jgi:hypothetical protein
MDASSYDEAARPTATPVVFAIALGVAPLPFLAIYAVLFIAHGWLHHVTPPDITSSNHGELIAGLIALALFVVVTLSISSFLNRHRRWFFGLCQLATLLASIYLFGTPTTGPSGIPILLIVTSAISLAITVLPVSARHVRASRTMSRAELLAESVG